MWLCQENFKNRILLISVSTEPEKHSNRKNSTRWFLGPIEESWDFGFRSILAGFRVPRKFQKLGSAAWVPGKFQKMSKKFWVPGTSQIFNDADPWAKVSAFVNYETSRIQSMIEVRKIGIWITTFSLNALALSEKVNFSLRRRYSGRW